jgi:hypothetical protein
VPPDEFVVGAVVTPVAGIDPAGDVVTTAGAAVPTVSLAMVKRKLELPPLCASGWLTCHETTHSPFGSGFGTVTLSDFPSNPTAGLPTAIGDPLHATWTVLVAPSGFANVSNSEGGDVSTVVPAAGVDETIVLSAAATRDHEPANGSDASEHDEGATKGAGGRKGSIHAGSSTLEDDREPLTPPASDARIRRSGIRHRNVRADDWRVIFRNQRGTP